MSLKPAILEWGTGVDVHGQNYTEAARRAVWDAIHHSSLTFLGLFGESAAADMVVEVTIAIPKPEEVDEATILAALPTASRRSRQSRAEWRLKVEKGQEISR